MKKLKIKNGEITTQQIVILIILVTSFVIILFFLFRLGLGEETNEELCRNSVVLKGNSVLPSSSTPLNCKRSYECITTDGTCEGLTNPEILKVKTIEEVYENLAEDMVVCWWMFGEGKINYIGEDFFHNNYCSICSQIIFDDSLKEIEEIQEGKISKDELYNYLAENDVSGKEITYAEYLFGTNEVDKIKKRFKEETGVGDFGNIEVGKQYFNVMGIVSEVTSPWKLAAGGGSAAFGVLEVLAVFTPINPAGWISAGIVGGTATAAGVFVAISDTQDPHILAVTVEGRGIDNQFMAPTIIEAESEKFKALNCEEIVTLN